MAASKESLEILAALQQAAALRKFKKLDFFHPYQKQKDFVKLTAKCREALLMAGNQLGKSECGAFMTACHLTGLYPDWWEGRRWDRPTKGWAAGETTVLCRDVQQKKLCGEPGVLDAFGTGMIPKEMLIDKSMARGATDAYDTIQVRHVSGGMSVLRFKSYEQGRTKFQGETLDFCWEDEEPPQDIHNEIMTRITATAGIVYTTFTPLKGRSAVVIRFMEEPSPDRGMVSMTIDDVAMDPNGHITPAQRDTIVAGYSANEREARAKGIPMLGSGRVYTASEEALREPAIEHIPTYWLKGWGIDFGMAHPFAAVLMLWDRDNDVIHVHHSIRISDALPIVHAAAMKRIGAAVPVAWPHDGDNREKGSGDPLADSYKAQGLQMLPERATHPSGGNSVYAGIQEIDQRMRTGRLKVASHLSDWFEEYSFYHMKEGQIVKIKDDLMDAMRTGIMMKRFWRPVALGPAVRRRPANAIAEGVDFDLD
jgi:phage terminase large subunit-like protein